VSKFLPGKSNPIREQRWKMKDRIQSSLRYLERKRTKAQDISSTEESVVSYIRSGGPLPGTTKGGATESAVQKD
jgi:hypothetical protein